MTNQPHDAEDQAWELLGQAKPLKPGSDFNQEVLRRIQRPQRHLVYWAIPSVAAAIFIVGILLFAHMQTSRRPDPVCVQADDVPVAENMELLDNLELLENLDSLKDPDAEALLALLPHEGGGGQ